MDQNNIPYLAGNLNDNEYFHYKYNELRNRYITQLENADPTDTTALVASNIALRTLRTFKDELLEPLGLDNQ